MSRENGNVLIKTCTAGSNINGTFVPETFYAVMRGPEVVKYFKKCEDAVRLASKLQKCYGQNAKAIRQQEWEQKQFNAKRDETKRFEQGLLVAKRADQEHRRFLDMAPSADTLVTDEMIAKALSGCDDPWHDNAERVKFRKKLEAIVGGELGGIKWRGGDTVIVYQPLNASKNMWHSVTYSC